LLAAGRLDRFLPRAARVKGKAYNIYTEPQGDQNLRNEISRRALRWGQALVPEDIAITCGCTEALHLALRAVTKSGGTVWKRASRPSARWLETCRSDAYGCY
jgi:DNA-binding transcriptional MocR family regulator